MPEALSSAMATTCALCRASALSIARALINSPALLIADEPTSSLDSENRDNFLALLMELIGERDMPLIFVSHDMALSEHFTRLEALSDITQRPC